MYVGKAKPHNFYQRTPIIYNGGAGKQMKRLVIIFCLFLISLLSINAIAEPPCTQFSHETLSAALACAQTARSARYMDSHHQQMMHHLTTQALLPPQTNVLYGYPYPRIHMGAGIAPYWSNNRTYRPYWYITFSY